MPRGKLNEVHVQRTAVEWLAKDYQNRLDTQAIVSGIEARVSKKSAFGNGRADGLIAAQLRDGKIYTISIEAKSSRTWKAINIQHLYEIMIFHAAIFASLVTLLLLILGVTTTQQMLLEVILPIIGITILGFCLINFSPLKIRYQGAEVVKQAERYPANEKWIALSTDIYHRLVSENQSGHFEKICLRKGVGLIRVTSSTKSYVLVRPKPIPTPKNIDSFLFCYARAKIVQDKLALVLQQPNLRADTLILDERQEESSEMLPMDMSMPELNSETEQEATS